MSAQTVNLLEAKSALSRLVHELESGAVTEFIIARNGRPAARLLPLASSTTDRARRIGIARGRFEAPARSAEPDEELVRLFDGG